MRHTCVCRRLAIAASCLLGAATAARAQSVEELRSLSIGELANVTVTSVSKEPEALNAAPASIYVITHDEIVRSGLTRLPAILRLAPNLFVAQTSASDFTMAIRLVRCSRFLSELTGISLGGVADRSPRELLLSAASSESDESPV